MAPSGSGRLSRTNSSESVPRRGCDSRRPKNRRSSRRGGKSNGRSHAAIFPRNRRPPFGTVCICRFRRIRQLLAHVKKTAIQPWVYPMFVMAAHTGARRSELVRSQVADFDDEYVIIHERKRKRGKHTTRRVPLSKTLRTAIAEWLADHAGGPHTFYQNRVRGSKKMRRGPQPVTRDEANDHFQRTLHGSKWEKIKGWHCLRHSFISNLASRGVDQRLIDEFAGHSTEAMRRRYRHLFPETKAKAIQQVFG